MYRQHVAKALVAGF